MCVFCTIELCTLSASLGKPLNTELRQHGFVPWTARVQPANGGSGRTHQQPTTKGASFWMPRMLRKSLDTSQLFFDYARNAVLKQRAWAPILKVKSRSQAEENAKNISRPCLKLQWIQHCKWVVDEGGFSTALTFSTDTDISENKEIGTQTPIGWFLHSTVICATYTQRHTKRHSLWKQNRNTKSLKLTSKIDPCISACARKILCALIRTPEMPVEGKIKIPKCDQLPHGYAIQ